MVRGGGAGSCISAVTEEGAFNALVGVRGVLGLEAPAAAAAAASAARGLGWFVVVALDAVAAAGAAAGREEPEDARGPGEGD